MSLRKSLIATSEETKPVKNACDCIAHGCPLPGVYRLNNESSICRAHDDAEAIDWPAITTKVRQNINAMHVALDLTNERSAEPMDADIAARFVAKYGDDFEPHDAETSKRYGARAFANLVKYCRAAPKQIQ